jgi:prevent-host-death family protein
MDPKHCWQVQQAKAHLSALLEAAAQEPQIITCHARPKSVVLSYATYLKYNKLLNEFLQMVKRQGAQEQGLAPQQTENSGLTSQNSE